MKTSRWVVAAVAVVLISGQIAMASQGRRRSAIGGDGKVALGPRSKVLLYLVE